MLNEDRDAQIRDYWEDRNTESMHDQYLATLEGEMVARHVRLEDTVLDLGCGDGTGSRPYRQGCRSYVGLDRSAEMLARFAAQEPGCTLIRADLQALPMSYAHGVAFTTIITQRALINLPDAITQEKVLRELPGLLAPRGRLLVCEAFREGVERLNALRAYLGCEPIVPRWHNVLLDRALTARALKDTMKLIAEEDLSLYYFLTRVVHQALVGHSYPNWDSPFNRIAFDIARSQKAPPMTGYSTIILQVWERREAASAGQRSMIRGSKRRKGHEPD